MPHILVEYTDNLAGEAEIPGLLKKIAAKMVDSGGVFPIGGVRVKAQRFSEYVIADGNDDYAFVNVVASIGPGRDPAFKKKFFGELFEIIKGHFAVVHDRRYLALSLYVQEVDEDGSYRKNNIHMKFRPDKKTA